jgi:hypothetical protein
VPIPLNTVRADCSRAISRSMLAKMSESPIFSPIWFRRLFVPWVTAKFK